MKVVILVIWHLLMFLMKKAVVLPEHDHNANAGNQSDDHNHTVTISTHNGHKHSIDDPGRAHSYIDTIGELINDEEGEDEKGEHAINEQTTKTTPKCKHWYQRNSKCWFPLT